MEILIELIVWLFKAFFGDPEKTVDTTRLNRKPPLRKDRGAYTYGDESGGAPKTLEEILEEARRQAAQRRDEGGGGGSGMSGGTMRPSPPRPIQSTQPPPTTRTVLDTESESTTPTIRTVVGRPVNAEEPNRPFESISGPTPQQRQQQQQTPKQRRQAENLSRRPLQTAPPPVIAAIPVSAPAAQVKPIRAQAKKQPAQAQVFAIPDLLQAIRTAPPADKRDAARQAIVMLEIFGPPRSRRGFRPGGRGF